MESKVILVTGASSGIGFKCARLFAFQGHKVYAAARRLELMEPLRADGIVPLPLDVTSAESSEACVKAVLDAEGRIDVLVNNAGYGYFGAVETVPEADARRQMEVNVFGLSRMCSLVLPAMREQHSGRIVNLSSVAGLGVMYFGGWYNVSKFSVEALSDALRIELKPFGIDVVKIRPGGIHTDWGVIASAHLKESSIGTPYEEDALKEAEVMHNGYSAKFLAEPDKVASAISRAVNAKRPKAAYHVGSGAVLLPLMHTLLPARWWDATFRSMASDRVVKLSAKL